MLNRYAIAFLLVFTSFIAILNASVGDANPRYRNCVTRCEESGCKISSEEVPNSHPWDKLEAIYVHWKKGDCKSECQYQCMLDREKERESLNEDPIKYHGKWPFKRIYGIQEPASMAFSVLNLVMHFHGWMSFFNILYKKLPLKAGKKPYYEYACLWHVYGILSLNSWFWSTIFHSRYCEIIERIYYSSTVALVGYSLIMAILRSFNVKDEATRVMMPSPLVSFVATHILYINFFRLEYEWNLKVCVLLSVAQLGTWAIWGGVSQHPSRWKLLFAVIIGSIAMYIEINDFPPYEGLIDAHALRHAITIPFTCLWWSFIKDDATFLTSNSLKNSRKSK